MNAESTQALPPTSAYGHIRQAAARKYRRARRAAGPPLHTLRDALADRVVPARRQTRREWRRLRSHPRFEVTHTNLLGPSLRMVDAETFCGMYDLLFKQEIYRFSPDRPNPLIIEGGANIGLSTIYFKRLVPQARIIAFEPDPAVFDALQYNVQSFGLEDVELHRAALWHEDGSLRFHQEGSDAGRAAISGDDSVLQVPAVRLRPWLEQPIDLLKLDIEGAERTVVPDCHGVLANVRMMFIEYHDFVGQPQALEPIVRAMNDAGFRVHVQAPLCSEQPFYHRRANLGMDLQLHLFGIRDRLAAAA